MLLVNYLHLPAGFSFTPICGLPLCVRAARSIECAGFQDLVFLVHDRDIEGAWAALHKHGLSGRVDVITERDVLDHKAAEAGGVISLVDGGYVWREAVMQTLRTAALREERCVCAPFARNVAAEDIVALSDPSRWEQDDFLSFGNDAAGAGVNSVDPGSFMRVSSSGICEAEAFLLKGLAKKQDGIISRTINRRVSLRLTAYLMHTGVKPNLVTLFVFLIGVASGPLMMCWQGYWGLVVGSFCYYLAAILDGCDGELARLKYLGTPAGAWLDTVVDDLAGLSYLLGLYCSLYLSGAMPSWSGAMAVTAYLLTLGPRYFVMFRYLGSGDYQKLSAGKQRPGRSWISPLINFLECTVFRTDFIPFAAFVCALLGLSPFFAWCVALGTVFSALDSAATCLSFRNGFGMSEKQVAEQSVNNRG